MNWYRRNIKKTSEYKRIMRIAKKNNPVRKECSYKDCNNLGERHHPDYSKPEEIIWLCKKHHELEHHQYSICTMCGGKIFARGFCNKHYKQQRKLTDREFAERTKRIQNEYLKIYRRKSLPS